MADSRRKEQPKLIMTPDKVLKMLITQLGDFKRIRLDESLSEPIENSLEQAQSCLDDWNNNKNFDKAKVKRMIDSLGFIEIINGVSGSMNKPSLSAQNNPTLWFEQMNKNLNSNVLNWDEKEKNSYYFVQQIKAMVKDTEFLKEYKSRNFFATDPQQSSIVKKLETIIENTKDQDPDVVKEALVEEVTRVKDNPKSVHNSGEYTQKFMTAVQSGELFKILKVNQEYNEHKMGLKSGRAPISWETSEVYESSANAKANNTRRKS